MGYEMQWTIRSYRREANIWRDRATQAKESDKPGHAAYGLRQCNMWEELIILAEERFRAVNVDYKTPGI